MPNLEAASAEPAQRFEFLFNPRAIAVIGASPEPNRPGAQTIHALQTHGFAGAIYPVNPKYEELAQLRCYAAIDAVPLPCDIAVIALPATLVPDTIAACGRHGVPFAVVLGGGFREAGPEGQVREQRMLEAARAHGVRIIGPNCLGLANIHTRAYAAFGSLARPPVLAPGPVSAIIQSGGFGNSLVIRCGTAGIGFRQVIASGSESDLKMPELVEALVDDPETRLILIYMEGMSDGRRFVAAAERALAAGKPIVVWKAGNTQQGVKAAASHTANMTGSYDIYRAAFRQCGVIEVHDIDEAIDCVQSLLVFGDRSAGDDVVIMGGSGGSAVVFSDAADQYGIELATLSPATHAVLQRVLPGTASLENPIDYAAGFITDANTPRFRESDRCSARRSRGRSARAAVRDDHWRRGAQRCHGARGDDAAAREADLHIPLRAARDHRRRHGDLGTSGDSDFPFADTRRQGDESAVGLSGGAPAAEDACRARAFVERAHAVGRSVRHV